MQKNQFCKALVLAKKTDSRRRGERVGRALLGHGTAGNSESGSDYYDSDGDLLSLSLGSESDSDTDSDFAEEIQNEILDSNLNPHLTSYSLYDSTAANSQLRQDAFSVLRAKT